MRWGELAKTQERAVSPVEVEDEPPHALDDCCAEAAAFW